MNSAWTICTSVPLIPPAIKNDGVAISNNQLQDDSMESYQGPFSEYRTELGIQEKNIRLRLKFDYSILEKDRFRDDGTPSATELPPLHLKSVTVCREAMEMWPSTTRTGSIEDAMMREAFYGIPGAEGGLYDPPPIKSEEQTGQYMLLDLDGRLSVLFPYLMDQDPNAHNGEGWVHSLDWTPGSMRYQVDRKVNGGADMLGLRTLELSEVQGIDAELYRPRDGGENMRQ
jgi:hypothetical protein